MNNPDVVELLVGLVRSGLWMLGILITIQYRNWFAMAGCIIFVYTSTVTAFIYAGFGVPDLLASTITYISTPGTALMVCGMAYSMIAFRESRKALRGLDDLTNGH